MTQLVLEINDNNDLQLLLDLVKRLGISVRQKQIPPIETEERKCQRAIIEKGVPYSSFGDAAIYQQEIRKDRKLPFRD